MNRFLLTLFLLGTTCSLFAQKTMYIPREWRNRTDTLIYKESDPENKYTWSKSRSKETDNVIILWDNKYGSTNPSNAPTAYKVDIDDLSKKCEAFYQLECDKLGFVDSETSNLKKYKVMVLLNHSTGWICYGGGYDFEVPALWLSPSTCKPVGSAVAHEVGHSFHYMCYSEDSNHGQTSNIQTGFHGAVGNGAAIWETTANWQALQSYPNEIFTESYHHLLFNRSHNFAFTHEWHRYQAYMFLYYLCDKYDDLHAVADVWNYRETKVKDFNEVLMDQRKLSVDELYKLHFDFALHAVTWDLPVWKSGRTNYIGNYEYHALSLGNSSYQVSYQSCPQTTGFNVIPLKLPTAGTEVSTDIAAVDKGSELLPGDPKQYFNGDKYVDFSGTNYNTNKRGGGFRAGYVVLKNDNTTEYFVQDSVYCLRTKDVYETLKMTVPENAKKMWLVIAPVSTLYIQHKWDENMTNDDQWPYKFHLEGTNILTSTGVKTYKSYQIGDRGIGDIKLIYNVYMPAATDKDVPEKVTIDGSTLATFGTALQMTKAEVAGKMQAYSAEGPDAGKMMFYPYKGVKTLVESPSTVASGYGHWFNSGGTVVSADAEDAQVYSKFDPSSLTFTIGQKPGACTNGKSVTVRQCLVYNAEDGSSAVARFVFNVYFTTKQSGVTLYSTTYDEKLALPVETIAAEPTTATEDGKFYDLTGRQVLAPRKGTLYIHNGMKIIF